eukprot:gene14905-biopygen110899
MRDKHRSLYASMRLAEEVGVCLAAYDVQTVPLGDKWYTSGKSRILYFGKWARGLFLRVGVGGRRNLAIALVDAARDGALPHRLRDAMRRCRCVNGFVEEWHPISDANHCRTGGWVQGAVAGSLALVGTILVLPQMPLIRGLEMYWMAWYRLSHRINRVHLTYNADQQADVIRACPVTCGTCTPLACNATNNPGVCCCDEWTALGQGGPCQPPGCSSQCLAGCAWGGGVCSGRYLCSMSPTAAPSRAPFMISAHCTDRNNYAVVWDKNISAFINPNPTCAAASDETMWDSAQSKWTGNFYYDGISCWGSCSDICAGIAGCACFKYALPDRQFPGRCRLGTACTQLRAASVTNSVANSITNSITSSTTNSVTHDCTVNPTVDGDGPDRCATVAQSHLPTPRRPPRTVTVASRGAAGDNHADFHTDFHPDNSTDNHTGCYT